MRIRLPGAATSIGLRYFEPAPDLAALVSSYYLFRADVTRVADVMRADLGQIRFMLRGCGHYMFGDQIVETPEVCLLGPSNAATRFDVAGPLLVFGIGLHPAGWAALVREDASLHADRAGNAVGRFGPLLEDALDAMRSAPDTQAMVSIADVVIRALTPQAAEAPFDLTRITDAWLTGATDPSVDALVASLGVSARQAERLTKRIYGAPPKLLARKYRTLRAASLIGTSELHWSEAAGDAFFDQSHFIRDFKRFTGLTPTLFQNDPPPVTRLTLQRRGITGNIAPLARIS
ncbi:helix-turn-helix domain-containing protein [Sphingomonas solaris]|uniref:Helix-turn-helix domain-containing protein n=1 Tax=Alterirhizorhabdus solaris TaxID=2529389 RepID=A0A558RD20_9SPHN|nr:helix-turn-helix domain-containing protein [Sphingomonas solaris]TVV77211.1 helix-turn-helix domain-containing protein [Sphingomonas solaris]